VIPESDSNATHNVITKMSIPMSQQSENTESKRLGQSIQMFDKNYATSGTETETARKVQQLTEIIESNDESPEVVKMLSKRLDNILQQAAVGVAQSNQLLDRVESHQIERAIVKEAEPALSRQISN
jgi:hypothetical protein